MKSRVIQPSGKRFRPAAAVSVALLLTWAAVARGTDAVVPLKLAKPLIASWSFDEPLGNLCRDSSGHGCDVSLERSPSSVSRTFGVFGGALAFNGPHDVDCGAKPVWSTLPAISFSAWVQPAAFDIYNEIFRKEDDDRRVLFSFQENGHALSLGLNINGYVECRARIDPAGVVDGDWHHAAATFDGKFLPRLSRRPADRRTAPARRHHGRRSRPRLHWLEQRRRVFPGRNRRVADLRRRADRR